MLSPKRDIRWGERKREKKEGERENGEKEREGERMRWKV